MLAQLLVLAVLTEAVTELVKNIKDNGWNFPRLSALVFGQVVAWGTGLDLLALVGVTGADWLPYVGIVLTGLALSRGANYVHDLWDRIGAVGGGQGA